MSDVAAAAGVNKATVSRVLRGDPRISSSTAEKVWGTIKALGYRPDAIAKGLSSRSSDTVGLFFRDLAVPWAGEFLAGFERVTSRQGCECMFRSTGSDRQQIRNAMYRLISRRVDGLVWIDCPPEPDSGVPGVAVGLEYAEGVSVMVDPGPAVSSLTALADGRAVKIRQGERPLFPGIISLVPREKTGKSGTVRVFDGVAPPCGESFPDDVIVVCTTRKSVVPAKGCWKLYWPAFELGTLSARVLLNTIKGRGVRPDIVRLLPVLSGPV
jgi:LacI family transcriptional regulator